MADGVGKTVSNKGTNQFMRTGQTAGCFGGNPSVGSRNGANVAAKELKA